MKRLVGMFTTFLMASMIFLPATTLAFDPLNVCDVPSPPADCQGACTDATASSPACQPVTSNPISGKDGIIMRVATIIVTFTGIASIIIVIIGSIRYITSSGDPKSIDRAKTTILYALVGLVVSISARAIITFVINKI